MLLCRNVKKKSTCNFASESSLNSRKEPSFSLRNVHVHALAHQFRQVLFYVQFISVKLIDFLLNKNFNFISNN